MTDFLSSLMARSFSTETAIRPRVASLFEPASSGDATLREAPKDEPIEADTRGALVAPDGDPSQSGPKMSRPAPILREQGKDGEAKGSSYQNVVSPLRSRSESDSERPGRSVADNKLRENEELPVMAQATSRRLPLPEEKRADESEASLLPDPERKAPQPAATRPAATLSIREHEKENRGCVLPPIIPTVLTDQLKNAAAALNAGLSARAREKSRDALRSESAAVEPNVKVTIGRIEVRATPERKPVGMPRQTPAAMSLEEYLRERAERGG
jgi:hypothetical protein